MEKGFLTARLIFWSKEPQRVFNVWGHVFTKGAEILGKESLTSTILSAYRCTKCKLVLADYGETGDKLGEQEDKGVKP